MLQIIIVFVALAVPSAIFHLLANRIDRQLAEGRISIAQWRSKTVRLFLALVFFLAALIAGLMVML